MTPEDLAEVIRLLEQARKRLPAPSPGMSDRELRFHRRLVNLQRDALRLKTALAPKPSR